MSVSKAPPYSFHYDLTTVKNEKEMDTWSCSLAGKQQLIFHILIKSVLLVYFFILIFNELSLKSGSEIIQISSLLLLSIEVQLMCFICDFMQVILNNSIMISIMKYDKMFQFTKLLNLPSYPNLPGIVIMSWFHCLQIFIT